MSCIIWRSEISLLLKHYQSEEIQRAYLPALNDCTERKTKPMQAVK